MKRTILLTLLLIMLPVAMAFETDGGRLTAKDIRTRLPGSYEDACTQDMPHKFIMWTYDGSGVAWGDYGNGFFAAETNLGGNMYGIYSGGKFAGFYEGEFFVGKYKNGKWYLKNPKTGQSVWGGYKLFV